MFEKHSLKIFTVALALGLAEAGVTLAAETGHHQLVDGVDMYYGILPAQIAGKHPPTHEEKAMHGGVPRKQAQYHLVVALFDAGGKRISNAAVRATVGELGMAGTRKALDSMRIDNTTSFGNYFTLRGTGPYRIVIEVRLPDAAKAIEGQFDYKMR